MNKNDIINVILFEVLKTVQRYDQELELIGMIWEVVDGPDAGKTFLRFVPKEYDGIKPALFDEAPIIKMLNDAIGVSDEAYKSTLLGIRNELAKALLNEYIPAVKSTIVQHNLQKKGSEQERVYPPFNEAFDKRLVEFIAAMFAKINTSIGECQSVPLDEIGSAFRIHMITNNGIKLTFVYVKENARAREQLQLKTIYLPEDLRGISLSQMIINNLFLFCSRERSADFFVTDIINKRWEQYLLANGAALVNEDSQNGDTVVLRALLPMD